MTPHPRSPAPGAWPYRRVHAAACALALRRWLGRWAVFGAVAALVASAGAGLDTAAATLAALAAWLALPLARAAAAGGAWPLLAVLGVAAVGLSLLAAVRHLLWPEAWREAERALPIAPRETLWADLPWVALAALPWSGLQAAGVAVWLLQRPAWLLGHEGVLWLSALLAIALGPAAGLLMQRLRRRGGGLGFVGAGHWPGRWPRQAWRALWMSTSVWASTGPFRAEPLRVSPWRPLVVWPMRRGVAPRFARHAAGTLAAALLLLALLMLRPDAASGWLALQALVAMVAAARARSLAALELRGLLHACAALPLSPRGWTARLDAVSAAPALAGVGGLALAALVFVPDVRGAVLGAWVLWLGLALVLELRVPVADAAVQSARWLFLLVVALALASEAVA